MNTLRIAAGFSLVGGLLVLYRLTQALAAELAYLGPHQWAMTAPLFLGVGLTAAWMLWSAVRFTRAPSDAGAGVAKAAAFSAWAFLAGTGAGGNAALLVACSIHLLVLKPAVARTFRAE